MVAFKILHGGGGTYEGNDEKVGGGVERADRVELVWCVKNDLALPQRDRFLVAADLYLPLVHVHHFPKVVRFARKDEILVVFVVVDGNDLGDVDQAFQPCFYISSFHISLFPSFRMCTKMNI